MVLAELGELIFPLVPEFGESMKEEHQRAFARCDVMQPDAVHLGELVGEFRRLVRGAGSVRGEDHSKYR